MTGNLPGILPSERNDAVILKFPLFIAVYREAKSCHFKNYGMVLF